MKWMLVVLFLIFLSGCGEAAPAQETVLEETATVSYLEDPYTITVGVPKDAAEVDSGGSGKLYRHEGGEYELYTKVFSAPGVDSAVRQLTGLGAERLCIVETTRFGLPEYRFTWYEAEKTQLCRADLVMDGETCYAVVFSVQERMGTKYDTLITEVFSTFGLYFDEGV